MSQSTAERYYQHDELTDEERDQKADELADAWEARADTARKGE